MSLDFCKKFCISNVIQYAGIDSGNLNVNNVYGRMGILNVKVGLKWMGKKLEMIEEEGSEMRKRMEKKFFWNLMWKKPARNTAVRCWLIEVVTKRQFG